MKLPYAVTLIQNEDGSYFAEIKDLPGCMSQGNTLDETMTMVNDAKHAWITTALELGRDIPLPEEEREYSGKFIVRIPASLHRDLAILADKEGVSLNQMALTLLSKNLSLIYLEKQEELLSKVANAIDVIAKGERPATHHVQVKDSRVDDVDNVRQIRTVAS
ncbi:MAG: type II toxin-antitoxin system HicB family antitoxin [Actinobacteria bacterium]|nr:type II toxin-antitoxin system HicB family antitoxin [Actinomycetota bacterium]